MARVLVVDDAADLRFLLRQVLQQLGHSVEEAANGRDALLDVIADPPDLVVLDLQMPEMDGWHVLAELRANERTASVPVIICTVRASAADRARGWELGCDGYVGKPFDVRALQGEVAAVLARSADERRDHRAEQFDGLSIHPRESA